MPTLYAHHPFVFQPDRLRLPLHIEIKMRRFWLFLLLVGPIAGCFGTSHQSEVSTIPVEWAEQDLAHEDVLISLGSRDGHPVAQITRNGKPAADVMVFCRTLDEADALGEVFATVYEVAENSDQAYYVCEEINLPVDGGDTGVRFRVVLPENAESWTHDTTLP